MTEILHIRLEERGQSTRRLIYYRDNHLEKKRSACFQLQEIKELIQEARENYYKTYSPNFRQFGQRLFTWLDHQTGVLRNFINQLRHKHTVLAISGDDGLADLPWEILHDGQEFLVNKTPSIIPVRWLGNEEKLSINNETPNRPLNILFMATSPITEEGGLEELEFELEENSILDATDDNKAFLVVEESGSLTELEELVRSYKQGETQYFDIFHLTGHGSSQNGQFHFLTEDEFGGKVDSTENDIANALTIPLPKLIFFSGCESANMARNLLREGATATLGWGKKVLDEQASLAASNIYRILSSGQTLIEALAVTYRSLINSEASDWHMLRMYVGNNLPSAFVTSKKYRGRASIPIIFNNIKFEDEEGNLISIPRESFVGRRRVLQKCLRVLKREGDKAGVFLQGGGGLGKTAIALRLWNRLPNYRIIHIRQQINDESILIDQISKEYLNGPDFISLKRYLKHPDESLESKLKYLLDELKKKGEKSFLFILDDFEWNCLPSGESGELHFPLEQKADEILSALVLAVKHAGYRDRIIITSRYKFDSTKNLLNYFHEQPIDSFKKATLKKKLRRLKFFNSKDINSEIKESALELADGNPRLLEFLDKELANLPQDEIQQKIRIRGYQENSEVFREQIIWDDIYEQLEQSSGKLRKVLSNCLIFEIPVPRDAFEAICSHGLQHLNLSTEIERGINSGLIEETNALSDDARLYRVHRILPQTISSVRLPEAPEVYPLYRKAHDKLHELWGNRENESEEKWREIFRLLFADRDNPERFRQGFSKMLAVQYNRQADSALESELRRLKDKLPKENLCCQLKNYLSKNDWRKADEETAWLFYLVMVQQGYKDWEELCENFPSEILNKIDQLWVNHSKGKFGFSIQKRIWESVGGNPSAGLRTWIKFGKQVEWYEEKKGWKEYNSLPFSMESRNGKLPALNLTRLHYIRGFALDGEKEAGGGLRASDLFSRIKT